MHRLYLHEATSKNLFLFIYSGTVLTRTISATFKNHIVMRKGLQFHPALRGFALGLVFAEGEGPEFTPQSIAAERPIVNRRWREKQHGISQSGLDKGRVRVAFN